jgi:hypothetical protein
MMVWGAKDITNLCTNFSHRKTLRFLAKKGDKAVAEKINISTYSTMLNCTGIPHEV